MEFEDVLRKRRSIREFQKKDIPSDIIERILKLANLSPSAGNLQARKVIVVRDEKIKEKLVKASLDQDFIAEAPVVFVILADLEESAQKYGQRGRKLYSLQDATIFTSYLQLVITFLGLASCWVGAFNEEKVSDVLGIREGLKPLAIIPLGYGVEKPSVTERKKIADIIEKEI
jgi:nitroreductase